MVSAKIGILFAILILCLLFSFFLTKWFYQYIKKKNILDIPNKRSLHSEPKVRGGGMAILISYLLFIILLFLFKFVPLDFAVSQVAGAFVLGTIGWLDDNRGLPIWIRFPSQFFSALLIIFLLNDNNQICFLGSKFDLGLFSNFLIVIFIVWMINLYNFMDGIDGIAISQAIIPSVFLSILFWDSNHKEISLVALTLIAASISSYKYNWPPSKMFMGDVLSGFLGFFFAALTLYINNYTEYSPYIILVLMGLFIFDATYTLIKRSFKREKIWEAHSTHFYQQFAKIYGHKRVTIFFIIINFVLFLPAYCIIRYPDYDIIVVMITYISIFIMTMILRQIFLMHIKK